MPSTSEPDAPGTRPVGGRLLWELLRFEHFRHFLVLPLASAELSRPSAGGALALARGVSIAFLVLSFGYLANAVGDREMDADPAKNPLAARPELDDQALWAPLTALALGALALAATGPWPVLAATAVCVASGWAYSLGPRLKTVPIVGTLLNATNFAPLLFLGLTEPTAPGRLPVLTAAFVALLLENQLLHEAADAADDRAGGVRTTFLVAGVAGTAALAALGGAVLLGVTLWAAHARGFSPLASLHAVPHLLIFPVWLLVHGRSGERMRAARIAQRWFAALSGALLAALTW